MPSIILHASMYMFIKALSVLIDMTSQCESVETECILDIRAGFSAGLDIIALFVRRLRFRTFLFLQNCTVKFYAA